jgi:2-polyprenyl-3-methyl-5-hydroxy-6-metoxy-1,4-benzoquinol methylase
MFDITWTQGAYPALEGLIARQLAVFPEHGGYLGKRFAGATAEELTFTEGLAEIVTKIAGDELDGCCRDYRWLAEVVLEEEIFFRRQGRYRLSTFEEANAEIYSNLAYMTRYMNGLLLSQIWWHNHTAVMRYFREVYLPGNAPGARHLEIGPGHGLFLYYAARNERTAEAAGWDISPASIARVKATFAATAQPLPELALVDMFEPNDRRFDSIAFSEVLEHLEQPAEALDAIVKLMAPGGRLFLNAPVNSPAPDHISLFRSPEEIIALVEAAGLVVEDSLFAPTSGASLARARKLSLAISVAVTAKKP